MLPKLPFKVLPKPSPTKIATNKHPPPTERNWTTCSTSCPHSACRTTTHYTNTISTHRATSSGSPPKTRPTNHRASRQTACLRTHSLRWQSVGTKPPQSQRTKTWFFVWPWRCLCCCHYQSLRNHWPPTRLLGQSRWCQRLDRVQFWRIFTILILTHRWAMAD